MEKKVRVRLVQALVIVALALGVAGFPWSAEAHFLSPCSYYAGCEYCACREHACQNGQEIPECGGNFSCCSAAVSNCWRWCTWY